MRFLALRYFTAHVHRFPREGSQRYFLIASFEIKIVCFERLIGFLAMRDKIQSIDHYVTYRNEVDIGRHIYISTRTLRSIAFLFTSKGLTLEGFTTFMDCCLRTKASNVVRNEVDYFGGID